MDLSPSLQAAFLLAKAAFDKNQIAGYYVMPGDTFRSMDEQEARYAQGRTKPGKIVTYARPGRSKHNVYPSQAIDVLILDKFCNYVTEPDLYHEFAIIMTGLSPFVKWGGRFRVPDISHFQL